VFRRKSRNPSRLSFWFFQNFQKSIPALPGWPKMLTFLTGAMEMKSDMYERTRRKIVDLQAHLAILRLRLALRAYDPNQPRWPAGRSDGGQWRPENNETLVAGKLDQRREAMCLEQHERDSELCRASGIALCWPTAMTRRAACIAGTIYQFFDTRSLQNAFDKTAELTAPERRAKCGRLPLGSCGQRSSLGLSVRNPVAGGTPVGRHLGS